MQTSTTAPTSSSGTGTSGATTQGQAQPKLPVPTSDTLMAEVAAGTAASAACRAKFLSWNVTHAVPQIVRNALDPALVELIVGPKTSLLGVLRKQYTHMREQFPKDFRDVAAVWREQRAWWVQFVEPSGQKPLTAWNDDVLKRHPSGPLHLKGHAPRRRRPADERCREGAASICLTSHAVPPATFSELNAAANATRRTISVTAGNVFRSGLGRYLRSKAVRTRATRSVRGKRICLYVPDKVAERATRACKTTRRSMSALVAAVLHAEFERRRKAERVTS